MKAAELQQSTAFLRAHGLTVEPEQLQAMLRFAISELQKSLYPPEPRADLTQAEAEALSRGGLDLSPATPEKESALARTTAKYAALLETSLTTAEATERLGVDPSRIRQRLTEGTLLGIRTSKGWRLPAGLTRLNLPEDDVLPKRIQIFGFRTDSGPACCTRGQRGPHAAPEKRRHARVFLGQPYSPLAAVRCVVSLDLC